MGCINHLANRIPGKIVVGHTILVKVNYFFKFHNTCCYNIAIVVVVFITNVGNQNLNVPLYCLILKNVDSRIPFFVY